MILLPLSFAMRIPCKSLYGSVVVMLISCFFYNCFLPISLNFVLIFVLVIAFFKTVLKKNRAMDNMG